MHCCKYTVRYIVSIKKKKKQIAKVSFMFYDFARKLPDDTFFVIRA